MQMFIMLLIGGYLLYLIFKSIKEKSYRQGFFDGQRNKNREGSIDVEYTVVKNDEKKG